MLALLLLVLLLVVGGIVLWLWMLIEVLTRETDENNLRLVWTLVLLFTQGLGALVYLLVRRQERIKKLGR